MFHELLLRWVSGYGIWIFHFGMLCIFLLKSVEFYRDFCLASTCLTSSIKEREEEMHK